jgi:phosphoglycerate dehydrogenase-like enzyme
MESRGNILITALREDNFNQIGEFVIGGILCFAKNFYQFREVDRHPPSLWSSKWRDNMMTLKDKVLVQIGLDRTGSEIAMRARQFGMKVWGIQKQRTFHPHCNKCLTFKEMKESLQEADVVVFNLPRTSEFENVIGKEDLESIKPGAIVVLLGNPKMLDLETLTELANRNHFRGIIIDVAYQMPLSQHSPIWKASNCLITPDVAQRPKVRSSSGISSFRYNLRQYVHGNFKDMRGIITDMGDLIVRS